MKRKYLMNYNECLQFRKEVIFNSLFLDDYVNSFINRWTACIICEGFIEDCKDAHIKESAVNLFKYINYMLSDEMIEKIKNERDIEL